MKIFKVGSNIQIKRGFTLLELLTVISIIAILNFIIIYNLELNNQENLKEPKKIVKKLLQMARTMAILKKSECRILALDNIDCENHERLLKIIIKEKSGGWKDISDYISLPKGIKIEFERHNKMSLDDEDQWNFISFNLLGLCSDLIYLKDNSTKKTIIIDSEGKIEIET